MPPIELVKTHHVKTEGKYVLLKLNNDVYRIDGVTALAIAMSQVIELSDDGQQREGYVQLLADVTAVVREADEVFEKSGGGSRHWVRECFFPMLWDAGFAIIRRRAESEEA